MAVRSEELIYGRDAVIYRFPRVRPRRARAEVIRRRAALVAVGVIVVIAALFGTGPRGIAPASPSGPRTVVLRSGQTLWDVAERFAPVGVDPRAYLDALVASNGGSVSVVAGTRLRLP